MKIAYVLFWNPYQTGGVNSKVRSQVEEWLNQHHEAKVYYVYPLDSKRKLNSYETVISANLWLNRQHPFLNKLVSMSLLVDQLNQFQPDILYLRQTYWFPGLLKLIKGFITIHELNTIDTLEVKTKSLLTRILMRLGRRRLNRNLQYFIGVSNEILLSQKPFKQTGIVISNGIDLKSNDILKIGSSRPQLIFVGSENCPWHGVDKIKFLASQCPEFDFNIVGYNVNWPYDNIICHGKLNLKDVVNLYSKMTVGIGSLAMHRIGLHEASPLKVREYIKYRLPVIIGYIDTDIKSKNFVLELPNDENNVARNILSIKQFVEEVIEEKVKIREEDLSLIDSTLKEKKRLDFFRKVLTQR